MKGYRASERIRQKWLSEADSRTVCCQKHDLNRRQIGQLTDVAGGPAFVIGFTEAGPDFSMVAAKVQRQLPAGVPLLLVSSEGGEICSGHRPAGPQGSDSLVLQSFSRRMIGAVQIFSVPLPDEDIRKHRVDITVEQRVELFKEALCSEPLEFPLKMQDTVALAYIDGLSGCETFTAQAMYESRRFPCIMAGGAAGADRAKRHTYIYDGQKVRERNMVVCLLKLQAGYQAAGFYANNAGDVVGQYTILDANSTLQTVHKVVDEQGKCSNLIDTLQRRLRCASVAELRVALQDYVFGTEIAGRLYVRELRHIGEAYGCLHFHCGFAMGESIFLLKKTSLQKSLEESWQSFTAVKPPPIAGVIHDCCRHFRQTERPSFADVFDGAAVSGFACRSEFFGVPMNESLVGLFFFRSERPLADEYLDSFPIQYANFSNYFMVRRLKHIQIINDFGQKAADIIARQQWQAGLVSGEDTGDSSAEAVFSQALDDFNVERVFDYKSEKKIRQVISAINEGSIDGADGEIGTLVTYMQMMINRLHGQRNVLERKMRQMEKSVNLYSRDELTGSYSRRSGFAMIRQILASPGSLADCMTLAFIDIDNLKAANDIWGHDEGDFYLRTVVEMLSSTLAEPDIICRYGGDEFLLVMLNRPRDEVEALLQQTNAQLRELSELRQKGYKMSFSFGTMFHDYSEKIELEQAVILMDARMYRYKSGRQKNASGREADA